MIVVDSSAVEAVMLGERLMSVANYVEAGTVLAGPRETPARAIEDLDAFLTLAGVDLAPVDGEQARLALYARIRFGRGSGAPAGSSFGDCFAYALAKTRRAPLLFIGDDFGATDVACAMPVARIDRATMRTRRPKRREPVLGRGEILRDRPPSRSPDVECTVTLYLGTSFVVEGREACVASWSELGMASKSDATA